MSDLDRELQVMTAGERARTDQDEESARRTARAVVAFREVLVDAGVHECQVDDMADRYLMSLLFPGGDGGEDDEEGS